jgi:hypothetical protein
MANCSARGPESAVNFPVTGAETPFPKNKIKNLPLFGFHSRIEGGSLFFRVYYRRNDRDGSIISIIKGVKYCISSLDKRRMKMLTKSII